MTTSTWIAYIILLAIMFAPFLVGYRQRTLTAHEKLRAYNRRHARNAMRRNASGQWYRTDWF